MTSPHMPTSQALTIQQPTPLQTDKPQRKVSGRCKRALDLMVWDGLTDNQAAVQTGLSVTAIRIALRQPHVRAYYHGALQVLREREGPRNIHALCRVRDQDSNQMATVAAAKALLQLNDQPSSVAARGQVAGFIINIVAAPGRSAEAKPLIEHDAPLSAHDRASDEAGG